MTQTADHESVDPTAGAAPATQTGPRQAAQTTAQPTAPFDEHYEKACERGWYYVDLDDASVSIRPEVLALMEARVAREYNAIPVVKKGNQVTVAVEDPDDLTLGSRLRPVFTGLTMRLIYANPAAIRRKIDEVYSARNEAAALASRKDVVVKDRADDGGDLGRVASSAEGDNVQLLRLIIEQALRDNASDVHIEPIDGQLVVRYRVDGKLREIGTYPPGRTDGLITLIKVESEMRTDNHLVPDSGVMAYAQAGRKPIDIRVETAPTAWGQSAVMRLQANIWRPLDSLGFSEKNMDRYRRAINQPFGVILATGPTGSGKSTTLYASLAERISPEQKIVTLEHPIEYKAPSGISQMQMNEDQGMTFAGGLRSILRQDPDIILVGEIRDQETAETAIDAAMTGHLVFSTLHTNDAPGAIPRLTRMGIEPLLLADSLLAVVGQRLVRRLCPSCKVPTEPERDLIEASGFSTEHLPEHLYAHNEAGCQDCRGAGWAGRVPIHEVMLVSDDLADAIATDARQPDIKRLAAEAGMETMREDGFEKMLAGLTTLSEINGSTRQRLV